MKGELLVLAVMMGIVAARAGTNEIDIAREALRDGLWNVAIAHAEKDGSDTGKAVVLEALAEAGDWEAIAARLKKDEYKKATLPSFEYYRAIVSGNYDKALKLLKGSVGEDDGSALAMQAWLLAKQGKLEEANKIRTRVIAASNVSERAWVQAALGLNDAETFGKVLGRIVTPNYRQRIQLALGMKEIENEATFNAGEKRIREVAMKNPDVENAETAMNKLAEAKYRRGEFEAVVKTYGELFEVWPTASKMVEPVFNRGMALKRMGKNKEADDVFKSVLERFPNSQAAAKIKAMNRIRELDEQGRESYGKYDFKSAKAAFEELAKLDPGQREKVERLIMLCLYGEGNDSEAIAMANKMASGASDEQVKNWAKLWLAKYAYNRGEWKTAAKNFKEFADADAKDSYAPAAMLWRTKAIFADNDCKGAVKAATELIERHPESEAAMEAFIIQSEALIELARFDEALLVIERAMHQQQVKPADKARLNLLKGDSLFAMGGDDSARYTAALSTYEGLRFEETLGKSERLIIAYKLGRTLEKLGKYEAAEDQYYTQVIVAYRNARLEGETFSEEAKSAFSRAAFVLAEGLATRNRVRQAISILELVATSDVAAAEEAKRRIAKLDSTTTR